MWTKEIVASIHWMTICFLVSWIVRAPAAWLWQTLTSYSDAVGCVQGGMAVDLTSHSKQTSDVMHGKFPASSMSC